MVDRNSNDSLESMLTEGFIVGDSDGSWCEVFPLYSTSKLSVGRDGNNDIVISDVRCSREHCVFRKLHGNWYVCDLGSSNGTFVNGNRIERLQLIRPGDRIKVASQNLLYAATVIDPKEIIADFATSRADSKF
ncbi:MAG: FHA domain-containing protein [Planctomycetota bacterium]|nr:FHA domain-containing protein [Planctomycetota bacterium]